MSSMMMSQQQQQQQQQPSSNGVGLNSTGHYSTKFQSPMNKNMNGTSNGNNKYTTPNSTRTALAGSSLSASASKLASSSSQKKSKKPISYETFAPRSQTQRQRLAKLQALTSGPIPSASTSSTSSTSTISSTSKSTSSTTFTKAMIPEHDHDCDQQQEQPPIMSTLTLTSTSASDEEQQLINSTLQKTHQTSQHISQILTQTSSLTQTLNQTITLTKNLTTKHSSLLQHSSELSYNAEKLQSQYDMLINHANDIGLPLKHYDDVDRLGLLVGVLFKNGVVVKGIARVKVDDDVEFNQVLDCINDAIGFFERRANANAGVENGTGDDSLNSRTTSATSTSGSSSSQSSNSSGSIEYYKRSITLQEAAIDLLKQAIVNRVNTTTSQIMNALQLSNIKNAIHGDVLEASMVYTRFHGISHRTHHLMNMIYKRMNVVFIKDVNGVVSRRKKRMQMQQNGTSRSHENANLNDTTHGGGGGSGGNDKNKVDFICPYTELFTLCRNTYIVNRTNLLKLSIRNHLDFLKSKHGLIGMTRLASVFLMRLCTVETSLYLDFFGKEEEEDKDKDDNEDKVEGNNSEEEKKGEDKTGEDEKEKKRVMFNSSKSSSTPSTTTSKSKPKSRDAATLASQVMSKDGTYYDNEFQAFLDNLCDNLHRTIRRGLVSVLDLDTLCQIVSVLREERSLANSSPTTMAAARSIGRVIVDAQERLIFCANSALGKEVIRFKATPMDLNYPDKLRKWKEDQESSNEDGNMMNGNDTNKESKGEKALLLQMQVYESWFPPIRSVLKVLSKIFRVVEPNVFEDIALTSIQSCSRSLKDGSMYIEKKSGVLHSDLFLVKNLLILREQLSPFDMQLRSVERQLDFSDAGKAVSRFIANRNRRLFSMTSENALVTLLSEGMSTREKSIDSKRDLEDALRSACNDFIEHTSVSLAGPVVTFVEQCKSASSAGSEGLTSLSEQSFMAGEYVLAVMTRALDRLEPELGEINTQMSLYMDSAATRSILLKPVIRKITRLLEECRAMIDEGAVIDDSERWTEQSKNEVMKVIDKFEKLMKSASPRV